MYADRKDSPANSPELYRDAKLEDIWDSEVQGFFTSSGSYWRKNGQPKAFKRNPQRARVPVKFGMYGYDTVDVSSIGVLFVKL